MTLAVQYRHDKIIGLFLKESSTNGLSLVPAPTETESTMMMCVASKYYPDFQYITTLSGAALRMQREVQWFKAVESWVAHQLRVSRLDPEGKTYWEQFVEDHEKLLENGQKWVKETADKWLFLSVAATLLFLAILTSPNEPQDFLDSLPKKIIMGLLFLFLSLVFMLVAFAATLTCVLDKTMERVLIPIILLASFPLTVFAVLQHPLLSQMIKSTYGPSIFRSEDIWKRGIIIG
ncbi:hypothetical protein EUGRSUZ_C02964 [Eucalyptus grandis]|uniref:Uncharacterized protein n=2 Tax=Eucalyptus grandis TaxID=71139 RepID=A0ACC3LH49_EUCGR|nr:hypothetical protein EUGRSUZ_C02964 [Eucalyptus grandis]